MPLRVCKVKFNKPLKWNINFAKHILTQDSNHSQKHFAMKHLLMYYEI